MLLTEEQSQALKAIQDMQKAHPEGGKIVVIGGPAGTGKSTLLRALCDEEGDNSNVLLAPTGKAALRIREVTGQDASTIHKWLYTPEIDREQGTVDFGLKAPGNFTDEEIPSCGYVVVDECSMVGLELFRDIYYTIKNLGLNLVLIGDPFQLPPVKSDFSVFEGLPTFRSVWMTTIHRQAAESPIIRALTAIRDQNWSLALRDLKVINRTAFEEGVVEAARNGDGIGIVHRNVTRRDLNTKVRKSLWGSGAASIVEGERLIVTKNNYDLDLYNGEILTVDETEKLTSRPNKVTDEVTGKSDRTDLYRIKSRKAKAIVASTYVAGENSVDEFWYDKAGAKFAKNRFAADVELPAMLLANYGYAITCHKSQGNSWSKAYVYVEPTVVNDYRWTYTALSRSERELYVCFK